MVPSTNEYALFRGIKSIYSITRLRENNEKLFLSLTSPLSFHRESVESSVQFTATVFDETESE